MKNTPQIAFVLAAVAFLIGGCASPYASQISQLDKAYAAGNIPASTYFPARQELIAAQAQWIQERNARIGAFAAASAAQSNAQIQANQAADRARNDAIIEEGVRASHEYTPVPAPAYVQNALQGVQPGEGQYGTYAGRQVVFHNGYWYFVN